jgi:hypothetical protein
MAGGSPDIASTLAGQLLDAVDQGSSARLLEVLSHIAQFDLAQEQARQDEQVPSEASLSPQEWERLELLRALAVQLRLDLHAMLMHIYQRVEASRGYLDVVRHLAGREANGHGGIWNALPGMPAAPPAGVSAPPVSSGSGQDFAAIRPDGEK